MSHQTHLERVRTKLHRDGLITRNQCLSQFPAITRLSARIQDLEDEGYVFEVERVGGDYVYRLVSIAGVPFQKSQPMTRADHLKIAKDAITFFDNYQPTV